LAHSPLHRWNIKRNRPLHAVEVIVKAGISIHKQRSGYPAEIQRQFQVLLEAALDKFNGPLHIVAIQRRPVALGNDALVHGVASSLVWYLVASIIHHRRKNCTRKMGNPARKLHGAPKGAPCGIWS